MFITCIVFPLSLFGSYKCVLHTTISGEEEPEEEKREKHAEEEGEDRRYGRVNMHARKSLRYRYIHL